MRTVRFDGFVLLLLSASMSVGCASIATSGQQTLSVDSEPPGAQVLFNGAQLGQTPTQVRVPRQREGVRLVLRKSGYQDATVQPGNTMSGWIIGNVILGGVIGTTVDVATGSSVEYSPDSFFVTLTPEGAVNHSMSPYHRPVSDRSEVKAYMLVAFEPLLDDILVGKGRHLDTLLMRLSVPAGERDRALAKLQSIVTLSDGDALTFSNMVLGYFPVEGAAASSPSLSQPTAIRPATERKPGDGFYSRQQNIAPTPRPTQKPGDGFYSSHPNPTPTSAPRNYF